MPRAPKKGPKPRKSLFATRSCNLTSSKDDQVIHAVRIPMGRTCRSPIVTVGAVVAIVTRMQGEGRGCPRDTRVPTAHAMLEAGGEMWRNLEVEARRGGGGGKGGRGGNGAGCSRVQQGDAGWSRMKQDGAG